MGSEDFLGLIQLLKLILNPTKALTNAPGANLATLRPLIIVYDHLCFFAFKRVCAETAKLFFKG